MDALYHYNILRPLQLDRRRARAAKRRGEDSMPSPAGFDQDESWTNLLRHDASKKAVVLVSARETIVQRIKQRTIIEEPELKGHDAKDYPYQKWLKLIEQTDLVDIYQTWCRELRARDIPYLLVNGNDDAYSVIEDETSLPALVDGEATGESGGKSPYSREQIAKLLQEHRFGYHRVNLPYGLRTRGEDRSETRDLVLPQSLAGKSVLDVGSALGYFCFEAEERGADRVVGVELREDRFCDAQLLKEIKGSNVEFIRRDVVLDPPDESFDLVLLLNVIHHLAEPFRAIRQLASITRERLVIEFPTLADQKFRESLDVPLPPLPDDLPLVGVSSLRQDVDQTFVFSPAAIRRVVLDHDRLFEDVEIIPSPMAGRAIAICHKGRQRD